MRARHTTPVRCACLPCACLHSKWRVAAPAPCACQDAVLPSTPPLSCWPGLGMHAGRASSSSGSGGGAYAHAGGRPGPFPTEQPPPGCEPDAYKLFIGNVPKRCTEHDLRPVRGRVLWHSDVAQGCGSVLRHTVCVCARACCSAC